MDGFRYVYTAKSGERLLSERTYLDAESAALEAEYVAIFPDRHHLLNEDGLTVAATTVDFDEPVTVIAAEAA